MAKQSPGGIQRLFNAFGYSSKGIAAAWSNEQAFRQEVFASMVLLPLALWIGESGVERGLLVGSVLLVPLVELINSALEAVVDRFGGEHHELSGRAKDMGSAAVLLSLVLVVSVWGCILI